MKKLLIVTLAASLFTTFASAQMGPQLETMDEHEQVMTTITGTIAPKSGDPSSIQLNAVNHGFAGSIGQDLVMGHFAHDDFMSTVLVRRDGKSPIASNFGELPEGGFGGTAGKSQIRFVKINKSEQKIYFDINGTEVAVQISARGFENNHFIQPTYTTTIDQKTVQFSFGGQACYGYSTHLLFMILGAIVYN